MTSTWPDTDSGELIGGGRYRLGEVIGTGGMATVHRAHDLVLDRDVAVKVFREDVAEASDSRRIEAEMKLLGSVNHPGLVTLHDAAVSDDGSTAFLVMELVEGTHLAKLISQGAVSPDDAAEIVAQVAAALAHIHRKNIVHRDVKPANILVRRDEDGRVRAKLADLGIARVAEATGLTTAGTILGTVAYLSPEQVNGGELGPAADVYALGLVLLECLTGQRPFPGTAAESAAMRTVSQPPVPSAVDDEFGALIASMTRLRPEDRITAAEVETTLRMGRAETGPTRFMPRTALTETATASTAGTAPTAPTTGAGSEPAAEQPGEEPPTTRLPAPTDPVADPMTAATVRTAADTALAGPPEPATTTAPAISAPTAAETGGKSRKTRRIVIAAVALLLVIAAAVAIFFLLQTGAGTDGAPPPRYPPVEGELGELLEELQRSVQP